MSRVEATIFAGGEPVTRETLRRRSLRQAVGPVAKQSIDAFLHEPLLPGSDTGLGLVGLGHDCRGAQIIAAQKDNARAPDMLLRASRGATIACKR
jgi:chromosome segregation and condensation protein ScpB